MTVIRFRRGNKSELPIAAPSGMPLWCEDTKKLYLGTDNGIEPIIGENSFSTGFIPYSVNSGNQDSNGFANLINKVSATEVSFKVGSSYPNMGITFPNGNYYVVSSLANILDLSSDGIYIFVLMENNLTSLEDGTFSGIANAVRVGYTSQDNSIPVMTSNSQENFTVNAFDPYNDSEKPNAYLLFDKDNATGISFAWGYGHGIYATLSYIVPIKMTKCQFYAPTSSGSLSGIVSIRAYGSNDGINWTEVLYTGDMRTTGNINSAPTFDCHSPDYYTHYKFQVTTVNLVGGYSSTTSNIRTINPYYDQEFLGGNITEDIKFSEEYDESLVPAKANDDGVIDGTGWTSSASTYLSNWYPWKAFDGGYDTYGDAWSTLGTDIAWLKLTKDSGTFNLTRISIQGADNLTQSPKDFTIKDELDNVLATFTNQTWEAFEVKYFDVIGIGISAVKVDVTDTSNGNSIVIAEVKLYGEVTTADGDLHVFINQKPLKSYLRQSTGWIEKQFVKLGQVQKLSGLLGTPISYAFNGYNISQLITIPVATRQIIEHAHNIGSYCFGDAELVCISDSGGYSAGDTITEFYARTPDNNFAFNRPYYKNNMVVRHGTWHISNGLFTSVTKDYKLTFEILATNFKIRFITKRGF